MAVLPILRWPDPALAQVCLPVVDVASVRGLAADMLATMYAANGRGLAAPQVGAVLRLFVMDVTWKEGVAAPRVLADPVILWRSETVAMGPEGCLSIPGVVAQVSRSVQVRVGWTDPDGAAREQMFDGFAAICVQHEVDHLDGIVTLDHLEPDVRAAVLA